MSDTTIQWTDKSWNPVTGCTKVSAGCKECYAERVFPRAYGKDRKFTDVLTHPDRLDQPLHWRKPARIFVNSMSDLFHEDVPFEFIDRVFAVMALADEHTFQILTKRPERMLAYLRSNSAPDAERRGWNTADWLSSIGHGSAAELERVAWSHGEPGGKLNVLPNVWLGVSVENQETADERIPLLLQTPAAVRFVSYEPALGPFDLARSLAIASYPNIIRHTQLGESLPSLDWLIAGSESGPRRRPSELAWFRSVRDQCQAAGVAFFMKQMEDLGGNVTGEMEKFPADLRVRDYPTSQELGD